MLKEGGKIEALSLWSRHKLSPLCGKLRFNSGIQETGRGWAGLHDFHAFYMVSTSIYCIHVYIYSVARKFSNHFRFVKVRLDALNTRQKRSFKLDI